LGERLPCTEEVRGSNPLSSTIALASNCSQKSSQKFTKALLDKFLTSRPSGTTSKSIESYHYTLDNFIGYPITPEGISSYLSSLRCQNGKAKFFSCLKALSRWLYHNGYIAENVINKVSPPKTQRKLLPVVSKEQLEVLIHYCHCERDIALISFLWDSGTRLSECANVKAKDFDWTKGTVTILGKGNRYRKALAGNGLVKKWFNEHDSFEISRAGIMTMLRRLSIETGIKCNPHSFRRGFAIHNLKSGLSTRIVQSLGGWDSIVMVERYSRSLSFDDALEVYRSVNGMR
jgi:integrase/recombinase XerC